jgi:hypothetical protein
MKVTSMWNRRSARDDVIVKEERHRRTEEVERSDDDERVSARSEGHNGGFHYPKIKANRLRKRGELYQIDGGHWKQGGDGKESEVQFVEVLYAHGDFKLGSVGC